MFDDDYFNDDAVEMAVKEGYDGLVKIPITRGAVKAFRTSTEWPEFADAPAAGGVISMSFQRAQTMREALEKECAQSHSGGRTIMLGRVIGSVEVSMWRAIEPHMSDVVVVGRGEKSATLSMFMGPD